MNDMSVLFLLKNMLNDEEPNIRWDAAVALAKLNDKSGIKELLYLLDRSYFKQFSNVDDWEIAQAMMVSIKMSEKLIDDRFISKLKYIALNDVNLKIRDSAIKVLQNTYKVNLNAR